MLRSYTLALLVCGVALAFTLDACAPAPAAPTNASVSPANTVVAPTNATVAPATSAPTIQVTFAAAATIVSTVQVTLAPVATIIPTQPAVRAQLIVLSNSSPHISVIDAETNRVVRTADIPYFTSWGWNDDNNYSDGKNLWLGMRNPDTDDVEVVLLDLDSLQLVKHIPLGRDKITLYIGKASREGKLFVSKHASGQMAVIDLKTYAVLKVIDLPVNGGNACDVDVVVGSDGKERAYVPTDNGNTVLGIDTTTFQVVETLSIPEGTRPFMLIAAPDRKHVWVQERTSNGVVVLDALTLQVLKRVPTGMGAITGTFSPDGKLAFTGHSNDTVVTAHDSQTFKEVWRVPVGTNPETLGVHPNGQFVYASLSKEAAVAVLDASTGKVITRVPLGTNPSGLYVRALK